MILGLMLATALFAAEPASQGFDRDCMDDYGRDLCRADMMAAIRERFEAPAAESLADKGLEGVRVFMVDGYSQDKPLISILKAADQSPTLEVRMLIAQRTLKVLTPEASAWNWEVGQTLARLVLESPETAPSSPGCLHAWVAVIEVIRAGKVTTRIRNACSEDAIFEGAYALSPLALKAMPGCSMVDPKLYRNESALIEGCAVLEGEFALQGAMVLNQLKGRGFTDLGGLPAADLERAFPILEFQRVFHTNMTMSWPGEETLTGSRSVAALWRRLTSDDKSYLGVVPLRIIADGETIIASGVIVRTVSNDDDRAIRSEASFTQEWRFDIETGLQMTRWTVGPFVPFVEVSEPVGP